MESPPAPLLALPPLSEDRPWFITQPMDYAETALFDLFTRMGKSRDMPAGTKWNFSTAEVASLKYIGKNFAVVPWDRFGLLATPEKEKQNEHTYWFGVNAREVATHPDAVPIIMAHEFKHASLKQNNAAGYVNVRTFRDPLQNMTKNLATTDFRIRRKIVRDKSSPHIGHHIARKAVKFTHIITNLLEKRLSRYEEHVCDNFAVRAFPEFNIDDFELFLRDANVRNYHKYNGYSDNESTSWLQRKIAEFKENMNQTHPDDADRFERMRATQKKLRLAHKPD
jgi:hypothetical protein